MITPRPNITVNADVTNPGQFFACCGLLELAHRLWPGAEGWFADSAFHVRAAQHDMREMVGQLRQIKYRTLALVPAGTPDTVNTHSKTKKKKGGDPAKILPLFLEEPLNLRLDWWLDGNQAGPLKLWSAHQTSARLFGDMRDASPAGATDLFEYQHAMTGRYGFDPRTAWEALNVGFSPNDQSMEVATYPTVELLAAIGLQRFRPVEVGGGFLRYACWAVPLQPNVAFAAMGGLVGACQSTSYAFRIVQRGKFKAFDFATPIGD